MDFSQLNQFLSSQPAALVGAAAFVAGCVLTLVGKALSSQQQDSEDPRNHTIRSLEADARAANRIMDDLRAELEEKTDEFNTSVATLQELRVEMSERESKMEDLEADLKESVQKTRELRVELQERAAESVREHVRAEEAATEAEVARAGSEAVMGEIARLEAEREELSRAVNDMGDSLLPDEELFGEKL